MWYARLCVRRSLSFEHSDIVVYEKITPSHPLHVFAPHGVFFHGRWFSCVAQVVLYRVANMACDVKLRDKISKHKQLSLGCGIRYAQRLFQRYPYLENQWLPMTIDAMHYLLVFRKDLYALFKELSDTHVIALHDKRDPVFCGKRGMNIGGRALMEIKPWY